MTDVKEEVVIEEEVALYVSEEVVEEEKPKVPMRPPRYLKRRYSVREDHIGKLDKISLAIKLSTSDIVEEALSMYFEFIKRNINQEVPKEVAEDIEKEVAE